MRPGLADRCRSIRPTVSHSAGQSFRCAVMRQAMVGHMRWGLTTSGALFAARFADMFGRRTLYICGLIMFTVFTTITGALRVRPPVSRVPTAWLDRDLLRQIARSGSDLAESSSNVLYTGVCRSRSSHRLSRRLWYRGHNHQAGACADDRLCHIWSGGAGGRSFGRIAGRCHVCHRVVRLCHSPRPSMYD